MIKLNKLKIVPFLLLLLAPISTWGMEQEEPIEKEVTLVAGDESTFNLAPEIVKLSGTIQDYLKDAKGAGIEEAQMPIPAAKATTLALFTNLANDIQKAIDQEKDSDKALDQKIQAPDGHIFAKNLQPIVNAALQDQDLSTLEELLKLTHFLDMPTWLENAVASVYIASIYKDLNAAKQKDPNFSLEAALQQELDKIDTLALAHPTKWLLAKHWYLKKAGIADEWSIKDLIATGDKPKIDTIGGLDLSKKDLTSLDGLYDIPNIKHVKNLSLNYNQLSVLEVGAFNELSALEVLDLGNNQLSALEAEVFNGLSALHTLFLKNNLLTTLPENIFSKLDTLSHLGLNNNQLTTLPENIFTKLAALTILDISNNQLSTLPENIFNNLAALIILGLQNNHLTTLPENIFNKLAVLIILGLQNNQLTTLPENIFSNLTVLNELGISNNQLSTLPENIFSNLTALKKLGLSNNQLSTLPENIFNNLAALNELGLSNNQLSTLPENIFTKLAALKYLLLSQNQLTTLPENIFNRLAALKYLNISNNPLPPEEKEKIQARLKEIAPNAKVKFIEESRK